MDGGRRQGHFRRRGSTVRAAGTALVAAVALLLAAPAAGAQDDPYGSTTTTAGAPPGQTVTCELEVLQARPGDALSATVQGLPPGGEARLLVGGTDVGGTTTGRIDFLVPELAPGTHLVTAVGVGFAVTCHAGLDGVEVLAGTITRAPRSGGLGALPRTGDFVGLMVAVAVALLLVGRALVEASAERRRGEARAAGAALHERAREAERRGLLPK